MKIITQNSESALKDLSVLQVFYCAGKYYIKLNGGRSLDLSAKSVTFLDGDLIVSPRYSELIIK